MALSAEAQHVLDSLEAHLQAVKVAVEGAEPKLLAQARKFGEDALEALEAFGATLRTGADSLVANVEKAGKSASAGKTFGGVTGNSSIPGGLVGGAGAPAKDSAGDVGSASDQAAGSLG